MSKQVPYYPFLWDLLFDRHPKGEYYRGQSEMLNV